ncbi:unnamed protein product [Lepeophtheirus salmonis]|uniref:(salmon louse) hypothetical protein n=1 Tax=Lepeophtheirus salmonis TaxID=72036 RepID=A0A7R8CIM3_LEPSM|nr:unnamed protein product [Lepeophtheirus salmonis]CAF2828197.1 unnamed protein product [Lepeophtheirus salmonis]
MNEKTLGLSLQVSKDLKGIKNQYTIKEQTILLTLLVSSKRNEICDIKKNCSMFHDLLKILTIYDFLVVICCALQFALPEIWPVYAKNVHPYVMMILLPSLHIVVMSSVYNTILISFERYIRICYYCQLKETNIITEDNIKYYQCIVILFPILFYIPKLFEINVQSVTNENTKLVNCQNFIKISKYMESPKTRSIMQAQLNSSDLDHILKVVSLCRNDYEDIVSNSSSHVVYRNITISKTKVLSIVPTSLRKNKNVERRMSLHYYQSNRESLISDSNGVCPQNSSKFEDHNTTERMDPNMRQESFTKERIHEKESIHILSDIHNEERRKSRVSFGEIRSGKRGHHPSRQNDESDSEEGDEEKGQKAKKFQSAISLVSNVRNSFSEKVSHINKERRLARISLCIVWLFIFCHACKLIPTAYEAWMSSSSSSSSTNNEKFPSWIVSIENISHTLITLNSALNFIIYIIL